MRWMFASGTQRTSSRGKSLTKFSNIIIYKKIKGEAEALYCSDGSSTLHVSPDVFS